MFSTLVNELEFKVTDGITGEVKEYKGFHNDLLNSFEAFRDDIPNNVTCYVGTNNTPTVPTMTALVSRLPINSPPYLSMNGTTQQPTIYDYHNEYVIISYIFTYNYPAGAINATIREVGFRFDTSSSENSATVNTRAVLTRENFDGIVVSAGDSFSVTYSLNFAVSLKRYTFNTTYLLDGVSTPIKVTIVPYKSPDPTDEWFECKDFAQGFLGWPWPEVRNRPTSIASSMFPNNTSTADIGSSSITSVTPAPGYQRARRILIQPSSGNLADGIKVITGYGRVEFEPAIPKNSDRILDLVIQFRNVLPPAARINTMARNIDYTLPIFDMVVNADARTFIDSRGFLTEATVDDFVFHKLKGVDCFQMNGRIRNNVLVKTKTYFPVNFNNVHSSRLVFFMSYTASDLYFYHTDDTAYGTRDSDGRLQTYLIGPNGSAPPNDCYLNNTANGGTEETFLVSNLRGRWNEVIFHHTNRKVTVYINGTIVFTLNDRAFRSYGTSYGISELWAILGYANPAAETVNGTYIHSCSFYHNHLVSPMGIPTSAKPQYPRTVLLLTYANGLPTNTQTFKHLARGGITVEPTGGPAGIPALSVLNGSIHILDTNLIIEKDEEFTLEFEGLFTNAASQVFVTDRSGISTAVGRADSNGACEIFPQASGIAPHSGSSAGSVVLTPYSTWASWTIVRRWVNGVLTYYTCKNGTVIHTRTYSGTNYETVEFLGKLCIGNSGVTAFTAATNSFKLANIRLTRGVIEYFNPAGFVVPQGLRTVIT